MTDKEMEEYRIIENALNRIFEDEGYKVIPEYPSFTISNDRICSFSTFIIPLDFARKIVELNDAAQSYWNSSDC